MNLKFRAFAKRRRTGTASVSSQAARLDETDAVNPRDVAPAFEAQRSKVGCREIPVPVGIPRTSDLLHLVAKRSTSLPWSASRVATVVQYWIIARLSRAVRNFPFFPHKGHRRKIDAIPPTSVRRISSGSWACSEDKARKTQDERDVRAPAELMAATVCFERLFARKCVSKIQLTNHSCRLLMTRPPAKRHISPVAVDRLASCLDCIAAGCLSGGHLATSAKSSGHSASKPSTYGCRRAQNMLISHH